MNIMELSELKRENGSPLIRSTEPYLDNNFPKKGRTDCFFQVYELYYNETKEEKEHIKKTIVCSKCFEAENITISSFGGGKKQSLKCNRCGNYYEENANE